jgi:hypothetical protein
MAFALLSDPGRSGEPHLMTPGNAAQADPVDGKGGVVVAESFVGNTEVL